MRQPTRTCRCTGVRGKRAGGRRWSGSSDRRHRVTICCEPGKHSYTSIPDIPSACLCRRAWSLCRCSRTRTSPWIHPAPCAAWNSADAPRRESKPGAVIPPRQGAEIPRRTRATVPRRLIRTTSASAGPELPRGRADPCGSCRSRPIAGFLGTAGSCGDRHAARARCRAARVRRRACA